ncbi:MAG: hemerythrin domain-containing protein, partial [Rhizomicrobium sp.]
SPAVRLAACGSTEGEEVPANEDLVGAHGVLRRALLIYREAAQRARADASTIPLPALHDTAVLFRRFGEDYHERKLEEAYIFPQTSKVSPQMRALAATLKSQHDRARQITDYILTLSSRPKFPSGDADGFARTMDALDLMYEHHAAIEDTVLFPAWKKSLGEHEYDSMGDKFEDIEKQTFGHDGFDDAVKQIAQIEEAFGLSNLSRLTPPPPPQI